MRKPAIDETGNVYGRLKVWCRHEDRKDQACWLCLCSCGNITSVTGYSLRNGTVKSCGCLYKEHVRG
jgi:hypothetical protein